MLRNAFLLLLLAGSSLAWWDASFLYRTPITMSNSGSNLTDYQVQVSPSIYNTTSLVGSWHFSEGNGTIALDSSGLVNDGTLLSGAAFAPGKFGNGLRLDGIDASASVPDSASLDITDSITIEAWVNATAQPSDQTDVTVGFHKDPSATKGTLSNGGMVFSAGSGYSGAILNKTFAAGENFRVVSYWAHDYRGLGMVYGPSVSHLDWTGWSFDPLGPYWESLKYTGFPNGYTGTCFCQYHAPITGGGAATTPYYFKQERSGNTLSLQYSTTSASGPWTNFNSRSPIVISSSDKVVLGWAEASGNQVTPLTLMQLEPKAIGKGNAYGLLFNGNSVIGRINTNGINASFSPGWNHIVLTYDRNAGSAQQKLYVNGALAAQGTLTEAITTNSNDLKIGTFNGSIDEVRIYNRSLSAQEISAHYAAKARSDHADIRFTWPNQSSGAEQEIPYWLESDKTAWVKVPSIPAAGTSTIYMYYGNASAASASSASNTFIREISGVIGAWDLNGDALDRSGNGNNGMLNGGMGYATGLFGQAARFDGSNDKINISDDNDLDLTNFSITGWVYVNSTTGTSAALFSKTTATSINYELIYTTSIYFQIYDGTNYHQVRTETILPNKWYFLSGTRDSSLGTSQQLKLYLMGTLNSTAVYAVGNPQSIQNNGEVLFGRNEYQNKWGNNSQSNFRLYNKVLSSDEIYDLYGSGGDRIGLVTVNYAGKELVRKYVLPEPTANIGTEQQPDTTAPSVQIQSPTSQAYATASVPVSFTATDDTAISSCTVILNGTTSSSACSNYTLTLLNSDYTLNVTVNDTSGNLNSAQVSFNVTTPAGLQSNTTQATTDPNGIAEGNISFAFTPGTLRISAGAQETIKAMKRSANVDRIELRAKITLKGQAVPGKQVTYTLSE